MDTRAVTNTPPPPPGFELIPPPPDGFEIAPPPGFELVPPPMDVSPAAGSRAAAEDQRGPQPLSRMEYLEGLAQKAVQGLTANFGDEIAAAMGGLPHLLTGGRYGKSRTDILKEVRDREKRFETENPKAAAGAEIAGAMTGGVLGGSAAARAIPWLGSAAGVGGTAARAGAGAAPMGAVDAMGRIEGDKDLETYGTEAAKGALLSGLVGAGTGAGVRAVGNVVGPWLTPLARELHDRGVRLTPGQMMGGTAQRLEEGMSSIPFIGQMVRNRQAEAVDSLNRAAYAQALEPAARSARRTVRVAPDTPTGHDAIQEMTDALGVRYNTIVPRMRANFDDELADDIRQISGALPQSVRNQYADAFRRHIRDVLDMTTGDMDGRALQHAFQGLRREATNLRRAGGTDVYNVDLADALMETHNALTRAAQRRTPARTMTDFRNLNAAYANFAIVRDAASRAGSEMGTFTPAGLHAAVRMADKSAGKGAMARGTARMEDLSGPAKSVMRQRLGDSGTPERAALMTAILAPGIALKGAVMGIPLAAAYTRSGNAAFRGMATAGRPAREMAQRLIHGAATPAGIGAGAAVDNVRENGLPW